MRRQFVYGLPTSQKPEIFLGNSLSAAKLVRGFASKPVILRMFWVKSMSFGPCANLSQKYPIG
jgi:hypothetical protein